MTNRWRSSRLLLLAGLLAVLAGPRGAWAQDEKLTGTAELGWRSFMARPSALQMAKFEEYRDMSPGPFLQALRVDFRPDSGRTRYELRGVDAFRRDQSFAGQAHRPGLFDLRLGWDQIPHTYSTDARMLGSTSAPFTLPGSLTRTLADTTAWKHAPYIGAVRSGWDVAQAELTLTPNESNDLKVDFTNISKSGSKPMSMSFSGVSLYREFMEPMDQNIRDLKLSESYVHRRYQVQLAYDLNAFDNSNASVMADNPLVGTSTATGGSAVGRAALAPSNLAQTFTMAGGLSLPLRTRFNGTLSYSKRTQNEPFIPYTANTAMTDARLATEPTSLNGDVRTLLANLTATTHPVRDVSVTARYRYWDFNDRTQPFTGKQMPVEVITDRSITAIADTTVLGDRFPYTRQNAGLEAHWTPLRLMGVQASYGWEQWNREGDLEVAKTNEYTPRLAVDVDPAEWLSLRGSISRSRRRNNGYLDGALNENFNGFRRFNMADRDRTAADLLAQLSPTDKLALSVTGSVGREKFPNSPYGVQSDDNDVLGADLSYMIGPRLTVFGSYTYEQYVLSDLNLYRDGTNPNNATFAWQFGERDLMQTAGLGLTGELVRDRLEVEARWDRSRGRTLLSDVNPQPPATTAGTATQQANSVLNATAADFPEINHTWTPYHISLRYQVNRNWSASVGFNHEDWESYDFRTSGLGTLVQPTPTTVSGVPLGNDLLPYKANYVTFTIGFRPGIRTELPVLTVAQ